MDVACLGETLVDFLPTVSGRRVADVEGWIPCIGGSPANVAVGLARLGIRSAMVGVVGDDEFGAFLRQSLAKEGVDISRLRQTAQGKTGLVFISLTATGERSFSFFRTNSAERFLDETDSDAAFFARAKVLHFGSNSLLLEPAQRAVLDLVRKRHASGGLVSCDPNLRLGAWADPELLRQLVRMLLPHCSLVKLSEEEIEFATGTSNVQEALRHLAAQGIALPMVTCGPKGAWLQWKGTQLHVPAPSVTVVDTTGAGDGFVAAFLSELVRRFADRGALEGAKLKELEEMARFACLCAAQVVGKLGAVAGLPYARDVAHQR